MIEKLNTHLYILKIVTVYFPLFLQKKVILILNLPTTLLLYYYILKYNTTIKLYLFYLGIVYVSYKHVDITTYLTYKIYRNSNKCTHILEQMRAHTNTCIYTHTHACAHIHTCARTHTHTVYANTHIHDNVISFMSQICSHKLNWLIYTKYITYLTIGK